MLTSGQLLAERYQLGKRIAVGGMGEVWEAVDVRLDRTVAVKVLKAELCGDAEFLHRFRTEARTTASLNHPGIAAVHDYGETAAVPDGPQDTAYLVMEFVEGEPLAATLAREGRLHAERTLDILEQAGHALQAAHERGLVHRDVKPGNILVTPTGKIKLTDFGIAKAADAAPVTRSGMVMGTAHYIAPEQALGSEATPSSDVYSLAVVGYECLKGHRPFLSDNAVTVAMMHIREIPPPLPPDLPPGARAVIEATLVKDPRRRYRGGGEFANAVASVRAGLPLPAPAALAPLPQQMPSTGVHPVPAAAGTPQPQRAQSGPMAAPGTVPAMHQLGSTLPSGVIPPQVPQQAKPRFQRTVLWILLPVVVVIVLILAGWATWHVVGHGKPNTPHHQPVALSDRTTRERNVTVTSLDYQGQLGQTSIRQPSGTEPAHADALANVLGVVACTSSVLAGLATPSRANTDLPSAERTTTCCEEAGATANRCLVNHPRPPQLMRVSTMGRPLTTIGTTHP